MTAKNIHMSKSTIKFYIIPGIVFIIVITIIIIIATKKSSAPPETLRPTPSTALSSPTLPAEAFSEGVAPIPLPIQDFTGADVNQELPPELKNIGLQKTTLRRLTPLTLTFATIEFDYTNDIFLVRLLDPKEESQIQFNSWIDQNYPALTEDKFIFN